MRIAQQIAIGRVEVFITWDIVSETATLLRYRWTHGAAARFLTRLVPELTVLQPESVAVRRAFVRDCIDAPRMGAVPELRCGLSRDGIDCGPVRL